MNSNLTKSFFRVFPIVVAFELAGTVSVRADLVYAANRNTNSVTVFTTNGVPSLFGTNGLNGPNGVACDAAGNVYVSGGSNFLIEVFTPQGIGSVFARTGTNLPTGLAFDSMGNLYVAYNNSYSIGEFTPSGVGSIFATTGTSIPFNLAFGPDGKLYASYLDEEQIVRFGPDGKSVLFASTGSNPHGMAFDGAGNLYVAYPYVNQVERFTPEGVGTLFLSTGLNHPECVAIDSAGNLYGRGETRSGPSHFRKQRNERPMVSGDLSGIERVCAVKRRYCRRQSDLIVADQRARLLFANDQQPSAQRALDSGHEPGGRCWWKFLRYQFDTGNRRLFPANKVNSTTLQCLGLALSSGAQKAA